MKSPKNKRTAIMAIILLALLIVAYKVMFVSPSADEAMIIDENTTASKRVEEILRQVENINFDTSVVQDLKFKSLKSIEISPISLPIGRKNPFLGI